MQNKEFPGLLQTEGPIRASCVQWQIWIWAWKGGLLWAAAVALVGAGAGVAVEGVSVEAGGAAVAGVSAEPIACRGTSTSSNCVRTLYLNQCEHRVQVEWRRSQMASSLAKKHQNWCSVSFIEAERQMERKFSAAQCAKMMEWFDIAGREFPERLVSEAPCGPGKRGRSLSSPRQPIGVLVFEKNAAVLSDVGHCKLKPLKRGEKPAITCPVLAPSESEWMRTLAGLLQIKFVTY